MILAYILLTLGSLYKTTVGQQYCYSTDRRIARNYASKTPYEEVVSRVNRNTRQPVIAGCKPKQIYMLIRHGTRHPSPRSQTKLSASLPRIQNLIVSSTGNQICRQDIDALRAWTLKWEITQGKRLSSSGRKEIHSIGQRVFKQYDSLLQRPYSPEMLRFRFVDSPPTMDSAKAFAMGLYNHSGVEEAALNATVRKIKMQTTPRKLDHVLRFYGGCARYIKTQATLRYTSEEKKYMNGTMYRDMQTRITKRLGLTRADIAPVDVDMMYEACRYEYAMFRYSPWCMVFTPEDIKVLEYAQDLEYYWDYGYGFPINRQMACPVVKDFMDTLIAVKTKGQPIASFNFVYSNGLLGVLSLLGLYKDPKKLRAANYASQQNRQWRTSRIVPYGANLELVLYQCPTGHSVAAYVNESPVKIPDCPDHLCPLSTIERKFGPIAARCDWNKICGNFNLHFDDQNNNMPHLKNGLGSGSSSPLNTRTPSTVQMIFLIFILYLCF